MSLELGWKRWLGLDVWMRAAIVVWVLAILVVCVRSGVLPRKQSVYPVWLGAGHDWRTSHDLYEENGDLIRFGYRYGPLAAAGFTVCDVLPEGLGNALWRLINGVAFLAALAWWLRSAAPLATTERQRGMFYLMNVPLALASLNNGQVNLLLIGLMLAALTAIIEGRWNLSAVCMALAVVLKIYPLAMVLLLCVAYPRKYPLRFLAAMAVVLALPFLMQHPEYVLRQYQLWWQRVHHADSYRRYWPLAAGYRDVWLLIRVWNLPINLAEYTGMQLAGGGICGVLCGLTAWRGWPDRQRTLVVLSLATAWMMLLGPSPESCTFVLVSPAVVWWLFQTRFEGRWIAHYLAVQGWGLLMGGVLSATVLLGIDLYHVPGIQPLGVLLYSGSFLTVLVGGLLARHTAAPPAPAQAPWVASIQPILGPEAVFCTAESDTGESDAA